MRVLVVALLVSLVTAKWVKEMENNGLFEGDIELFPDEVGKGSNAYASVKSKRWPNGVVPYTISSSLDGTKASSVINNAIYQYHKYTCLRFRKKTPGDRSYIKFTIGKGCSSPVGYHYRYANDVKLAPGCHHTGTVMHEIGHSIGLYHEQSRPDRDNYVTIITGNIEPGLAYNFKKHSTLNIDSLNTEYDFRSLMHYGATAFGKGKVTIQAKDSSNQKYIGNREGFSGNDIQQINKMYSCRQNVKLCGDGSNEGKECGCSKGYCWSRCINSSWWCYTNGAFQSSQNRNYVYCKNDNQCEQGWTCGSTCTV